MANNRRNRNRKPLNIDTYQPPFAEEILAQGIEVLNLKENTKQLLDGARIVTLKDMVKREDKDFYKISTFNKKNLFEIINALKAKGLHLKPSQPKETEFAENKNQTAPANNNPNNANNNRVFNNNKQPLNDNKQLDRRQNTHPNNNAKKEFKDNSPAYVEITKVVRPPKVVTETVKDAPDIYVKVNKNGKWGFKDREGKQVVEALYDEVFNFKEELCCVQKEDLFGFVNRNGEEVIPIIYSCATSFSEGLACVFKGDKCGYINANNETVIDFKFDAGTSVTNGECRVKKEGKWGELHIALPSEDLPDSVIPIALGVDNIRWII